MELALPLKTHPYQIEDLPPTLTSPITDALGATNASLATLGTLSNKFMRVRCRETETTPNTNHMSTYQKGKLFKQFQEAVKAQLVILVLLVSTMQPLLAIRPLDDHRTAVVKTAMPEELSLLALEVLPRGPVHRGPSTARS
ncbi:hypothetical protein QJS10_CPB15g01969 [Acorus calamus]|uniref:Uncharacterized protein n=1 Tax=Acorus calamus TaxID=4465 RepID=A0AAV9D7S2_ACOCL|nr:hypothetical protein QJS10_CPB15g01969 [Acorus calamus]